jgi:hypothetical protein
MDAVQERNEEYNLGECLWENILGQVAGFAGGKERSSF